MDGGGGKCDTTGKTQYATRREARVALDKLRVRRAGHKTERTAYPCRFCSLWHLSSQDDKARVRQPRLAPATKWRYGDPTEE